MMLNMLRLLRTLETNCHKSAGALPDPSKIKESLQEHKSPMIGPKYFTHFKSKQKMTD